jgi:hypothetical protein
MVPSVTNDRDRSSQSTGIRNKNCPQIYGYVLTNQWIKDFAARNDLESPGRFLSTASSVVTKITQDSSVKCEAEPALYIGIGHNRDENGLKLITRERIDRVKEVMEVDEPSLYYPG